MNPPLAGDLSQELSLRRQIAASPERVYAAWTRPELLAKWWAPPDSTIELVDIDLRVGGRYQIKMVHPARGSYSVRGTYQVIRPPRKLVFTWRWDKPEMDIGESLVTIELHPQEQATELFLTHTLLPNAGAVSLHREGWLALLDSLQSFLH